jgi:hypothetical protein
MDWHNVNVRQSERQRRMHSEMYVRNNRRAEAINNTMNGSHHGYDYDRIPCGMFLMGSGITLLFIAGTFCPPIAYATLGICGLMVIGSITYHVFQNW